jgi:hypothetical protein
MGKEMTWLFAPICLANHLREDRSSLLQNPRIQDDIGMKLKSTQSYPDQTTFQGISFCLIPQKWS